MTSSTSLLLLLVVVCAVAMVQAFPKDALNTLAACKKRMATPGGNKFCLPDCIRGPMLKEFTELQPLAAIVAGCEGRVPCLPSYIHIEKLPHGFKMNPCKTKVACKKTAAPAVCVPRQLQDTEISHTTILAEWPKCPPCVDPCIDAIIAKNTELPKFLNIKECPSTPQGKLNGFCKPVNFRYAVLDIAESAMIIACPTGVNACKPKQIEDLGSPLLKLPECPTPSCPSGKTTKVACLPKEFKYLALAGHLNDFKTCGECELPCFPESLSLANKFPGDFSFDLCPEPEEPEKKEEEEKEGADLTSASSSSSEEEEEKEEEEKKEEEETSSESEEKKEEVEVAEKTTKSPAFKVSVKTIITPANAAAPATVTAAPLKKKEEEEQSDKEQENKEETNESDESENEDEEEEEKNKEEPEEEEQEEEKKKEEEEKKQKEPEEEEDEASNESEEEEKKEPEDEEEEETDDNDSDTPLADEAEMDEEEKQEQKDKEEDKATEAKVELKAVEKRKATATKELEATKKLIAQEQKGAEALAKETEKDQKANAETLKKMAVNDPAEVKDLTTNMFVPEIVGHIPSSSAPKIKTTVMVKMAQSFDKALKDHKFD